MGQRKTIEKLVFIALLVALSVVLGIFEHFLSSFTSTQGVRLGLANVVILTGIYYLKFREALLLVILKSLLTGFILGNVMTFTIGFSGTLFSFFIMYTLIKVGKEKVSLIGVSVSGGISHNIGQIFALMFYHGFVIIFNLIWLIPFGIGTGFFVGYLVSILRKYLDKGEVFKTITQKNNENNNWEKLLKDD